MTALAQRPRAMLSLLLALSVAVGASWDCAMLARSRGWPAIAIPLPSRSTDTADGTPAERVEMKRGEARGGPGSAAEERITYVESMGIGRIAVLVRTPDTPRYPEGAPVVVSCSGFFVPFVGFHEGLDTTRIGAIYVSYLWPGRSDPRSGAQSDGEYDHGGAIGLAALRDVIRFATGEIPDVDGHYLHDSASITPLYSVSGLYAFSHSGIVGTNVLCLHGEELSNVSFFIGRENPTVDALYPLEPGHFTDLRQPVANPFYDPSGYTPTTVSIDYSTVYWLESDECPEGRPAFAVAGGQDYVCSAKHPQLWDKDYWSTDLLQALLDNGALTREQWPRRLATPEEAAEHWPFRTTVDNYPRLAEVLPELRVMLVFAAGDHVQSAVDKPHIHHAYDGFHHRAGLWCRMNPDRAYAEALLGSGQGNALPDNPANAEPSDWMAVGAWGYRAPQGSPLHVLIPLAAVAEMCDRTYHDNWSDDLTAALP